MSLSLKAVEHVAELARLHLPNPEAARADLSRILELMTQLETVDTNGVKPLAHPLAFMNFAVLPLRSDVAEEVTTQVAAQANAPRMERDLYLVPKVIE